MSPFLWYLAGATALILGVTVLIAKGHTVDVRFDPEAHPIFADPQLLRQVVTNLLLVHLIVEQAGGRVWCESEEGRGATFAFTLPTIVEQGHRR